MGSAIVGDDKTDVVSHYDKDSDRSLIIEIMLQNAYISVAEM